MSEDNVIDNLIRLFYRPFESIALQKGQKYFEVPRSVIDTKFQKFYDFRQAKLITSQNVEKIDVNLNSLRHIRSDIQDFKSLKRDENFSLYIPKHRELAKKLLHCFRKAETPERLLDIATYVHDSINPYLFSYALAVTLTHREDTKDALIPNYVQIFPGKFFDSQLFGSIRQELDLPIEDRDPVRVTATGTNSDPEHRLAYWREDPGLNACYYHWHVNFPSVNAGYPEMDRRGELFYYIHHQILARYNFERFCNTLNRVVSLENWQEPIQEAYYPKLNSVLNSKPYPSRVESMLLQNVDIPRQNIKVSIDKLTQWKYRIHKAIADGYVQINSENDDDIEVLNKDIGINTLGNIIEANHLSVNPKVYGDLNRSGHFVIAAVHDPNHHHLEYLGVMGDEATAMRDPVFYRWHAEIDDVLQQHKKLLPPYTKLEMGYNGVTVTNVIIQTENEIEQNIFKTYFEESTLDISCGLNFYSHDTLLAAYNHLQHKPFSYNINYINTTGLTIQGTCRIFLAPYFNETREHLFMPYLKNFFIELDKFLVTLQPGSNNFIRNSDESSVTIPFEDTFYEFHSEKPEIKQPICNCGWPNYLLIPKGTPDGYLCQLFVMISNDVLITQETTSACGKEAISFCGYRSQTKFPDSRPMGFPFDRNPRKNVKIIDDMVLSNMKVIKCKIYHEI